MSATPQQVRQWSEEVARDPGSLAFLPLAEAYRAQGRREAALKLCLRGLERHPTHVEAHHLLGLLYEEGGDPLKAFDEWDIALHLDGAHAGARRRIGLVAARLENWAAAVRHLERLPADASADPEVAAALALARSRVPAQAAGGAPAPEAAGAGAPPPAAAPDEPPAWETLRVELAALGAERGIVGAVMLDDRGYVLAGEMRVDERDRAPEVAAVLSGAHSEAERAIRHLGMGEWRGILLETPGATVRLAPTSDGGMVAVAARREAPTGWVLRIAARAREAAERYLGHGGGER
jgi:predicted regulator of Ras-like GTPase activity (Roadblock/LC7/MglB family)